MLYNLSGDCLRARALNIIGCASDADTLEAQMMRPMCVCCSRRTTTTLLRMLVAGRSRRTLRQLMMRLRGLRYCLVRMAWRTRSMIDRSLYVMGEDDYEMRVK